MEYVQLEGNDQLDEVNFVGRRFTGTLRFRVQDTLKEVEEGSLLMPKFGADGLIPCITQDAKSGEVLMLGYMNREALSLTITSAFAHYWSRSRQQIWAKGERSGQSQRVEQILIDDDQDCVLLKVSLTGGASCHVGYRSCFFRELMMSRGGSSLSLRFLETEKVFDPVQAYGPGHAE